MTNALPDVATSALMAAIERFGDTRILCIGDVMLDRFVYGDVTRISPEAPIPVMRRTREIAMLGGAGNVVRNLVSLGAGCGFISVIGDDATGHQLIRLVGEQPQLEPYLLSEAGRRSSEKVRFIAGTQQLLRCDDETIAPISAHSAEQLLKIAEQIIADYQILVLSDYGKGVLSEPVVRNLIALAKQHNIPVFIDPKSNDASHYQGASLLSPNWSEFIAMTGDEKPADNDMFTQQAMQLAQAQQLSALLVTRGRDGMSLIEPGKAPLHIAAQAREVFDVSGAGDTVMATLAVAHAAGLSLAESARLANLAAGIVVGRVGTATIYRTDLKNALHHQPTQRSQSKIMPQDIAKLAILQARQQGKRIGFTNGCYDLLHVGHLQSLQDAKAECDFLVIGVNSDASVKRLKGETRPVVSEMDRASLIAGLDCVDAVIIFREDTPEKLLSLLQPDILMKGADYTVDQVVGRELVESWGGKVVLLPIREGHSTTGLIKKLSQSALTP